MILAAHQPLFLPWLGFFDKVRQASRFVLVDHVQFERGDFQNRNRVLTRSGVRWLSVPVRRGARSERIDEKEIDDKLDRGTTWGEKLSRTLRHAYAKAPHFDVYMPFLEDALTRRWTRLVDLNLHLLLYFFERLEITTPVVRSSTLPNVGGSRSTMILGLCRATGATVYLSGSGGARDYLDTRLFEREGIEVRWQAFAHPRYPQPADDFVPSLSVVDLLFNCGPASAAILRGEAGVLEGASTRGAPLSNEPRFSVTMR